jgi:hypothetical protein
MGSPTYGLDTLALALAVLLAAAIVAIGYCSSRKLPI